MLANNIFRDILREEIEFRYHFYYVRYDRALTMFDGIARIPPRLRENVLKLYRMTFDSKCGVSYLSW
jgi:hypothetical protein